MFTVLHRLRHTGLEGWGRPCFKAKSSGLQVSPQLEVRRTRLRVLHLQRKPELYGVCACLSLRALSLGQGKDQADLSRDKPLHPKVIGIWKFRSVQSELAAHFRRSGSSAPAHFNLLAVPSLLGIPLPPSGTQPELGLKCAAWV